MTAAIIDKIKSADNLPSLPSVAVEALRLTQAGDVSMSEIADVIQNDPALTGKLLKVVNSSLFGMSRKISSLQQAMVVLGLRTVKVMVLSFSLVERMNKGKAGWFDYAGYWRRSLTTAVAARLLAEKIEPTLSDEAFVSGLLCDIGMLAACSAAKDLYVPVLDAYETANETFQAVEQNILGVTHETITGELLSHWGLPEVLCSAARGHHARIHECASDDPTEACLTRIVRAGAMIADLFCAEVCAGHLDSCKQQIVEGVPIEETGLHEVLEALDGHVKETASLFALEISPTRSYEDIRAEATAQLARLTVAAELERAETVQREQEVRQQIEELSDQNRELAQQASMDGLTGVGNRAALEKRLKEDCARAIGEKESLGLILLDLDRFKRLNDGFGHQIGDEALRRVGACLRRLVDERTFAARYGGEEFAVVVCGASAAELHRLAEEIRLGVQQLSIACGEQTVAVTISAGAVHVDPDDPGLDPKQLIERADQCLYNAKRGGRNRVVLVDSHRAEHLTAEAGQPE